ncbi:hypothetical protein LIER_16868 [Lithospermum erythrorhizon]|uniref:Uncharacterized protein n=1 Tax=Lithospermum erythrorhizon TaxID=34254 RepID=A0AAV3QBI1_LITER
MKFSSMSLEESSTKFGKHASDWQGSTKKFINPIWKRLGNEPQQNLQLYPDGNLLHGVSSRRFSYENGA